MVSSNLYLFDNSYCLKNTEEEVKFVGIPLANSYLKELEKEIDIAHFDEDNLENRMVQFAKIIEERKLKFETLNEKYETVLFLMRFFTAYSTATNSTPKNTIDNLIDVKRTIDSKENRAREANMYLLKLYEMEFLDSIDNKRKNIIFEEDSNILKESVNAIIYKGPSDPETEDPKKYFEKIGYKIIKK